MGTLDAMRLRRVDCWQDGRWCRRRFKREAGAAVVESSVGGGGEPGNPAGPGGKRRPGCCSGDLQVRPSLSADGVVRAPVFRAAVRALAARAGMPSWRCWNGTRSGMRCAPARCITSRGTRRCGVAAQCSPSDLAPPRIPRRATLASTGRNRAIWTSGHVWHYHATHFLVQLCRLTF